MLLLGVAMLVWMKVSPPRIGRTEDDDEDGAARPAAH
jgi:hypothetical protein